MKIVEFIFTMYLFTDIDECEPINPCGDVCSYTTPGYDCSCSVSGTKLDNDLRTCIGLGLWCLMPLSTIYHNGVRVVVFNATFNNISQWGYGV